MIRVTVDLPSLKINGNEEKIVNKQSSSELRRSFMLGNRLNFSLALSSLLILAVMNLSVAFILRYFIEAAEGMDKAKLRLGQVWFIAYLLLFFLFNYLKKKYRPLYFKTAVSQFKQHVFAGLLNKSIADFAEESSAKFLSAFSTDLKTLEDDYLDGLLNIIYTILMFAAAGIVLIVYSPSFGIPLTLLGLATVAFSVRFGSLLVKRTRETAEEGMNFMAKTKDLLNGFFVIKSFKAEKEVLALFAEQNTQLENSKQRRNETESQVQALADTISILINGVIYTLGFIYAFSGKKQSA